MSPFIRVFIPISVILISGMLSVDVLAQATTASQVSVDALEVKADAIEQKIDAIEAKLDVEVIDTIVIPYDYSILEGKMDAIEVKLDTPDPIIPVVDTNGPKLDAIKAKLDAHLPVDPVDLDPLATLGQIIEDKVDTNGEKIDLLEAKADLLEAKIDSLGGDIGGLEVDILDQVNSIRDFELEQAILACNCSPAVFLPESAGGSGERGIAMVAEQLENIKIARVSGLRKQDLKRAECYILVAQSLFDGSRYGTACEVLSGSMNILSFGKTKICRKARACDKGGDDDDDD